MSKPDGIAWIPMLLRPRSNSKVVPKKMTCGEQHYKFIACMSSNDTCSFLIDFRVIRIYNKEKSQAFT